MNGGVLPDNKESTLNMVLVQDVGDLGGPGSVRAIVEGERNFHLISGAVADDVPIDLGGRGISEVGSGHGEGNA